MRLSCQWQVELEAALAQLHDGAKVPLRYFVLGDEHRERVTVIDMDRAWTTMKVRALHFCDSVSGADLGVSPPPPPLLAHIRTHTTHRTHHSTHDARSCTRHPSTPRHACTVIHPHPELRQPILAAAGVVVVVLCQMSVRDDAIGLFMSTVSPPPPARPLPPVQPRSTLLSCNSELATRTLQVCSVGVMVNCTCCPGPRFWRCCCHAMMHFVCVGVVQSLVSVSFHTPCMVDGVHAWSFVGVGLVLDANRGIVLVDRNTVPVSVRSRREESTTNID